MALEWADLHFGGTVGFHRDLYDKYSFAPTMKELCAIAQIGSPEEVEVKQEPKVEILNKEPDGAPSVPPQKIYICNNKSLPEPKVPFPHLSSLTFNEQKLYMLYLKNNRNPDSIPGFPRLQELVNNETSDFMKYLLDVAKICADQYNFISQGAAQYSEECLRASLEMVKNYPQAYLTHDITSITGGKFDPGLSLHFEKQLLTLGNVRLVSLLAKKLPKNIQLADFESVSSKCPPVKKARRTHSGISNDPNAEKLYARYEPHVCMTSQAFHALLNNHGPEYSEQWEIPVWVKMTAGEDPRKEVYIDSPLVKTEMTVKEKIHIFHEESIKLVQLGPVMKEAQELTLDWSTSDTKGPKDENFRANESQRSVISFADESGDLDVDLTDLESFGESATKSLKEPKLCGSAVKPALAVVESPPKERPPPRKRQKAEVPAKCASDHSSGDSDEERLVIDSPPSPTNGSAKTARKKLATPHNASGSRSSEGVPDQLNLLRPGSVSDTVRSPSPESSELPGSADTSPAADEKAKRAGRRAAARASRECDQLGQILRMQSTLLKPRPAQDPVLSPPRGAAPGSAAPGALNHSQSLVKTCVSSYLEANQGAVHGASAAAAAPNPENNQTTPECKKLLSEELLLRAEDEQDYVCPEEGNLLYCLYSLKDVLFMVRSSAPEARKRFNRKKLHPVLILPKLQYQLCYGIECLTKSEICQLWAQLQLHSTSDFYICHIDPLTSRLYMMEELTNKKMEKASCGFVPAKPLNILNHLIKKVCGLQEGRYLLCHKAGESLVTVLEACKETTTTRATYDLHQAHAHQPQAPPHSPIPWVPVDPTHLLYFHRIYDRIPCTFPPRPDFQANRGQGAPTRSKRGKPQAHGIGRARPTDTPKGKGRGGWIKWCKADETTSPTKAYTGPQRRSSEEAQSSQDMVE